MIGNQTLIEHVWQRAIEANIGPVWVATGDQEIANRILSGGGQVAKTPRELASGSDRVAVAMEGIDPDQNFDFVINLQGDMPNVGLDGAARAIVAMGTKQQSDFPIGTLIHPVDQYAAQNPTLVKAACALDSTSNTGPALYFSRQPVPYQTGTTSPIYYGHIGIYIFRRAVLPKLARLPVGILERQESLEQLRWLENGYRILAVQVDEAPISVDTHDDLEQARSVLKA